MYISEKKKNVFPVNYEILAFRNWTDIVIKRKSRLKKKKLHEHKFFYQKNGTLKFFWLRYVKILK